MKLACFVVRNLAAPSPLSERTVLVHADQFTEHGPDMLEIENSVNGR